MKSPPLFRDADERDELAWSIRTLTKARRLLAQLHESPDLAAYRLVAAESGVPLLTSPADLAHAQTTLHQVARCLAHLYEAKLEPGDRELTRHDVDDPNPTEQDNDTPF